jgi:acetoin utilization deacetylase AcuC-like enzyme
MLKIAYTPQYHHPLPENHRFPMEKYTLLPEQLIYEGTVTEANFFIPPTFKEEVITTVHTQGYWEKLKKLNLTKQEIRKTGFPLSQQLIEREVIIMNGTIQCALFAMKYGIAMNIAGGTHHAFTDRGEGFCLLNDIAIAAQYLLDNQFAKQILVVDLDVHQGNGTAQIFENEPRVFTFSMHGESNYPMHKEKSDLDIGLPDGITDKPYLDLLYNSLPRLIEEVQPNHIFYLCGVDILETDKLGRLGVTKEGCKERDRFVLQTAKDHKIPITCSMGGGYSPDIKVIIDAHANTFRLAQSIYF